MTNEQRRIAIAEELGASRYNLPDYPNDLNAMRTAIMSLPKEKHEKYLSELQYVIINSQYVNIADLVDCTFAIHNATSLQRSEAFLRTVGRWVE